MNDEVMLWDYVYDKAKGENLKKKPFQTVNNLFGFWISFQKAFKD